MPEDIFRPALFSTPWHCLLLFFFETQGTNCILRFARPKCDLVFGLYDEWSGAALRRLRLSAAGDTCARSLAQLAAKGSYGRGRKRESWEGRGSFVLVRLLLRAFGEAEAEAEAEAGAEGEGEGLLPRDPKAARSLGCRLPAKLGRVAFSFFSLAAAFPP